MVSVRFMPNRIARDPRPGWKIRASSCDQTSRVKMSEIVSDFSRETTCNRLHYLYSVGLGGGDR